MTTIADIQGEAYLHDEDGQRWIRVLPFRGDEYDESEAMFTEVLDLTNGGPAILRHKDGTCFVVTNL